MLQMQGHIVSGISLDPQEKSLFNQAELSNIFENDVRLDIRKRAEIAQVIKKINPEVIIHLAAQPLVRESYQYPVETFDINVLGTLNILEATKRLKKLKATLVITTDKVYKNHNHLRGYVETDELGGDDPYSASKAAADIASQSWIKSFATSPIAIARAGNVIGGGDWALHRIIPDLVNAYSADQIPILRFPNATRPWQHVLDCLYGYIQLVDHQIATGTGGEWNFGPELKEVHTVSEVAENFAANWGFIGTPWKPDNLPNTSEADYLILDSSKARENLNWADRLNFHESIKLTVEWYKEVKLTNYLTITRQQIESYFRTIF
jgi:CDP-glucose 4,6-dehydratase